MYRTEISRVCRVRVYAVGVFVKVESSLLRKDTRIMIGGSVDAYLRIVIVG